MNSSNKDFNLIKQNYDATLKRQFFRLFDKLFSGSRVNKETPESYWLDKIMSHRSLIISHENEFKLRTFANSFSFYSITVFPLSLDINAHWLGHRSVFSFRDLLVFDFPECELSLIYHYEFVLNTSVNLVIFDDHGYRIIDYVERQR